MLFSPSIFRQACPSSVFQAWETLLQEVEIDSQAHSDIASILARQVSRPLLERSFYRKIQSRKVFTHRESYDTILHKTEDMLAKVRFMIKTNTHISDSTGYRPTKMIDKRFMQCRIYQFYILSGMNL